MFIRYAHSILIFIASLVIGGTGLSSSVYAAPPAGGGMSTGIEIDRIDLLGVRVFTSQLIESALEISPGNPLEKPKVLRTEENLQALYLAHGYEEVKIRTRLVKKKGKGKRLETVLEFAVTEGRPTRISSIRILPLRIKSESEIKAWKSREQSLFAAVGLKSGDVLDQEKLGESKREIQELLASEEFIGAKVEELKIADATPPSGATPETAARWVSVEFNVDFGDRVTFGFRGNTVFTRAQLDSLINEQRTVGLGQDYVGAIRSILETEYKSQGYAKVEITPYTFEGKAKEGRRVTYDIHEGPRVGIESLDFDGNIVFESSVLKNQFYEFASPLVQNGTYVEKDVEKAAGRLIEWMKEKGYLSAKLTAISVNYPPKSKTQQPNSAVKLQIYIYEGDQTVVRKVEISGASVFSPQEIQETLMVQEGKALNLFAFSAGVEVLKRKYRNQGYFDFKILNEESSASAGGLIEYKQENHDAEIHLQLDEGRQFQVGRIEVDGLERTKEFVVLRELTFHEGEILTENALGESERLLRRLGIFSSVTIRTFEDPESPTRKTVRVVLTEGDRGNITYGPGLRNDLGVRLFGQLSYANLWGEDHTVLFNATMNRRFFLYNFVEGQAQFSYIWPWFSGVSGFTFHPSISGGRTQYINFATNQINFVADSLTVSVAWDKQLLKNPNLMGNFAYTLELVRQFGALEAINNDQLLIGSISPRLSLDLRDNSLSPTSGIYATAWADLAGPFLGSRSDIGYYRVQFRTDYHLPLFGGKVLFYASFRTGYERNFEVVDDKVTGAPIRSSFIPLIKQFALGGVGSLRGYQELELNYQTQQIEGGLSYVNYRFQLDLPLSGSLKFGPFADAAALLINNYSFGGLKYGVGLGLHYQTPVGPVNLDWGFKVEPPPGVDPYVIHFSVGVI